MPDPFRKVQPGDPVTFSATAWNEMIAAAQAAARAGYTVKPSISTTVKVYVPDDLRGGDLTPA